MPPRILWSRILEWVAFPFSRGLPNPGIEPRSSALQVDSLSAEPSGKPKDIEVDSLSLLQGIILAQELNRGPALQDSFFFSFIFISWRLITLQYCSGFCHTLTWISHGFTCIPHPGPPSHLPPYPIPLGLPSAPGPSICLMHRSDSFISWATRVPSRKRLEYSPWAWWRT